MALYFFEDKFWEFSDRFITYNNYSAMFQGSKAHNQKNSS